MKNKEPKQNRNLLNSKIKVIGFNNVNLKKDKYNQDLIFNELNLNLNNEKIFPKYSNTVSYSNTENNPISNEQNNRILYNSNNNELLSQDKFIQTPTNFYSFTNAEKIQNRCFTPNNIRQTKKDNKKFKTKIRYKNSENIPRLISGKRQTYYSKSFYNKSEKKKNIKYSRNQLYPIIGKNEPKTDEINKFFKNIHVVKEYFNNMNTEKKKKHHNLLTIENIYFQKRSSNNIFKINCSEQQNRMKNKILQKKYSIKEIKYPLYDSLRKKFKVINENNDHLLEEVFKRQTLSNFNNKYNLKYKTNNNVKKENIKLLFSLLKKYKYSDEDKKFAFNKYNSMKRIKKTFNI